MSQAVKAVATTDGAVSRGDDILRISTELFDQHGYANVGMRAIADAVGIRPASLYHHFASKEEILYAISMRVTERYTEETVTLLERGADPRHAIRSFIERQIVFAWDNRAANEVSRREMRELQPEHLTDVLFHRARYRRVLQGLIEEGIAAKHFKNTNPKLTSLAILSMVNGVNDWFHDESVQWPKSKRQLKIVDVAGAYADLIIDHLLQ
jgi:AcrR family transcriptional regulator